MPHVATAKCVDLVWFMARPLQWRSEERVTGSHHFPSEDDSVHRHDACRWRGGSLQQSRKCMRGSGELKYLWCQYLPGTTLIAEVWPAAVTTWCAGMGAYSTSFVKKGWKRHFWWFDFEKKECKGRCTHAKFTQNILLSCLLEIFANHSAHAQYWNFENTVKPILFFKNIHPWHVWWRGGLTTPYCHSFTLVKKLDKSTNRSIGVWIYYSMCQAIVMWTLPHHLSAANK